MQIIKCGWHGIFILCLLEIVSFKAQGANILVKDSNPFVGCSFDGIQNQCVLDTGAMANLLPPNVNLGDKPVGSEIMDGMSAEQTCHTYSLTELKAGTILLDAKTGAMSCPHSHSGLIGVNSFNGNAWVFDFSNYKLRKEDQISPKFDSTSIRRGSEGEIYVPIKAAGQELDAYFDSGYGAAAVFDRRFVKANASHFRFLRHEVDEGAVGGRLNVSIYVLDHFEFLGRYADNVEVEVYDFNPYLSAPVHDGVHVIFGFLAMNGLIWHLDLKKNIIAIE